MFTPQTFFTRKAAAGLHSFFQICADRIAVYMVICMNFLKAGKTKDIVLDLGYIIAGCLLVASGLVMFTVPNHIAPGGSSGLATSLASILPLSVGLLSWLINVPLLIVSWKLLGTTATIKTLITSSLLSIFIDLLTSFLPAFVENELLAAVLGGILIGSGVGILFLRGTCTGGTELLSIMMSRAWPNCSIGHLVMLCDGAVVVIAAVIFQDLEVFLYSIITIFAASKAIDALMDGANYARVIIIITERGQEIADQLNATNKNGCTLIPAVGSFTGAKKNVIMAVVHPNTVNQTLEVAKSVDPELFAFLTSAAEVHGKGFHYISADGNQTL